MRIAAARSTSLSSTQAPPAKAAAGPLSFLAMLANASAQSEIASSSIAAAEPPMQSKNNSGENAAGTSPQAQTDACSEAGMPVNQAQAQSAPAAVSSQALEPPLQTGSGKGVADRNRSQAPEQAAGQQPKAQSNSGAKAIAAVVHAAIASPSAALALAPATFIAPPELTGAASPLPAAQPAAKPETVNATSTGEASKAPAGNTGAHFANAAIVFADAAVIRGGNQDKTQAAGYPPADDAGAAKIGVAQPSASAKAPSANAAAEPAPLSDIHSSDAMQSAIPLAIAPLFANGDAMQMPREDAQTNSPVGADSPKNVDASGDAKGKQSDSASAAQSPPAHNAAGGKPAVQRIDANPSQAVTDASKPASPFAPQVQGVALQGAPHAAAASSAHAEPIAQPSREGGQPAPAQAPEVPATSTVNAASLIQTVSEAEMRVAVHSTEFGAVSIRTSLSQQQMTAQITVDHGDLGRALSANVPAMETRLGSELGVRALVQVHQGAMSFSGEGGNSQQTGQRSYAAAPALKEIVPALTETDEPGLHAATWATGDYRLDIQA